MRRPAILAVDGGGSKIDATLVTRRGELVGAARWIRSTETGGDRAGRDAKGSRLTLDGQGFSPDHDRQRDREQLGAMAAAIDAACTDAGIDPAAGPIADVGVYCLAGADLPSDDRRIARVLRTLGWTGESLVRNDTFAVLRAGSVRGWGVAVVCGYGMNCSAVAPDGRTFRFPALGPLSGDWGGGMDVGSSAVWHAIRAEDGRGGPTSLALSVAEHFGLRRAANVAAAVHLGRLAEQRFVELAPLVFRAAGAGDRVARSIVDRQAEEVVAMAGAAIRKLRLTDTDVDVVLGGGIFRTRDREFFARIDEGLRSVAPVARPIVLHAPPVVGAALLGLDRVGGNAASDGRIRAAISDARLRRRPRRRGSNMDSR